MKKAKRRRPRSSQKPKASEQQTMDDNYYSLSSTTYLIESFTLNSSQREVIRKWKGKVPDQRYKQTKGSQAHQLATVSQQ